MERRDASKKKSDFEVLTINLIDRRYGVSSNTNKMEWIAHTSGDRNVRDVIF